MRRGLLSTGQLLMSLKQQQGRGLYEAGKRMKRGSDPRIAWHFPMRLDHKQHLTSQSGHPLSVVM